MSGPDPATTEWVPIWNPTTAGPKGDPGPPGPKGDTGPPGTGGTPGPHHVSHETGGTDALTALRGEVITSGTVADARLTSNVALKNINNNFTQPQYIQVPGVPALYLLDLNSAVNARLFQIAEFNGSLYLQAVNDAATVASGSVIINRSGGITLTGTLYHQSANTYIYFDDVSTAGVPNTRYMRMFTQGGVFYIQTLNDAQSAQLGLMTFDRVGNMGLTGGISVAGQMNAAGIGSTPVPAANITGQIADAKLSPNVALKNINNNFVAQTLASGTTVQGANALLHLWATASLPDARIWRFTQYGTPEGNLYLEALNDAQSVALGQIAFTRAGGAQFPGGLLGTPLNASQLTAGTVPVGRLGTSGAVGSGSRFLADDNTWKSLSGQAGMFQSAQFVAITIPAGAPSGTPGWGATALSPAIADVSKTMIVPQTGLARNFGSTSGDFNGPATVYFSNTPGPTLPAAVTAGSAAYLVCSGPSDGNSPLQVYRFQVGVWL